MTLPVSYNLRNLIVRKTTTIMTALGIALTVAVLAADMALVTSTAPGSGSPGGGAGFFVFYDASGGQTTNGDFKAEQVSGGFSQIAGTAVSNMTDMEIVFQVPHAWVGTIFIDNVVIQ